MKRVLVVLMFIGAFCGLHSGTASAGTYQANVCWQYAAHGSVGASVTKSPSTAPFDVSSFCDVSDSLFIEANYVGWPGPTQDYTKGQKVVMAVDAPAGSAFVGSFGVWVSYGFPSVLAGFVQEVGLSNGGGSSWIPNDANPVGGYDAYTMNIPYGERRTTLEARLRCTIAKCISSGARIMMDHIAVTIDDYTAPQTAVIGGPLVAPGTVSGTKILTPVGIDDQSGVKGFFVIVNDEVTDIIDVCPSRDPGFRPCLSASSRDIPMDTTKAPFHEGANGIKVCVGDYVGNGTCSAVKTITVDN